MTKSTITRDELNEVIATYGKHHIAHRMAIVLLAAMDSEPVMFCSEETLAAARDGEHLLRTLSSPSGDCVIPLYRHAQQPVVRPAPECQHQWRCGGANKLQNQRQCIKCGRVELDAQQPIVPATLPCSVELKPGLIIGKGCKTETLLTALRRRADYNADIDAMTLEERAEHDASIKAFKAMLAAAPQEVPDGK